MELLEHYLQAVRFWLPRKQQDDIIEELREDIRSRIEDKESYLGRTLTEEELLAVLQQTGNPMLVAGRYQKQGALIGPALFPIYTYVLKIVALGYLVPWVLVWLGLIIFSPSYRAEHTGMALFGTWGSFWSVAISLFGAVTIVFAVLERAQSRLAYFQNWDPRKLPHRPLRKQWVSRVESVFGLAFSVLFVFWWLTLPRFGHFLSDQVGGAVTLNSALRHYYLLPLVPTFVLMAQQCINLIRPQWTWVRCSFMLASDLMTLTILAAVATQRPYLVLGQGARDTAKYAQALPAANGAILWLLLGVGGGVLIAAIVHLFQTLREFRRGRGGQPRPTPVQISQVL
jgi:hypothetical protein